MATATKLKGLRKVLNTYFPNPEDTDAEEQRRRLFFEACRNTQFWWWSPKLHMLKDVEAQDRAKALGNPYIQCCFNHTISLPVKGNIERPL